MKAHRVAYELTEGEIAEGMSVLHKCDNPPCCNPNHLFLGTKKDNTRDMLSKHRGSQPPHSFGEKHHNTKFDEGAARKIIADQRTHRAIAVEYGISWMTVFRLKHGQTWKKLDREVRP
ncbi:HNH endonuclease signature motif containing protein [Bradyrhizobium uaiense]|uniref:HNH endonuclease signature motif containing protein n=1 Tax=Bradyrhizobium uaiense TaxID=2594946 RepID=UPI0013D28DA7|nr:HNH endonuclease signature motif containing protein [Bradyrhizobium uaiense]